MDKWDRRFLSLAEHISQWSKDTSTKVAAIIVDKDRRIMSTGYNGFPPDVYDDPMLYENRDEKLKRIIHAEDNAFRYSDKYNLDISGCTIYTWPFMPCIGCYDKIKSHSINRIVAPVNNNPRWISHFEEVRVRCSKDSIELKEINV